jgi:opacity protein-like surface antigen
MGKHPFSTAVLILAAAALGTSPARAQTDVALSVYGAFTGTTTGNGTKQSPSNAAGGIVELRHIRNPIIGYEATYSYNRANQTYARDGASCGLICNPVARDGVSANAHEITGDWVASLRVGRLRPFALAGVGVLLDVPANSSSTTSTTTKPVYVYGGGVDWGLVPHIGLRLQYRGNLYSAPNLTKLYTSTNAFTHTAEPMIGVYFRL